MIRDWIYDDPTWLYVVLAALAGLALSLTYITQLAKYLYGALVLLLLAGLIALADWWVVTDRERITEAVHDMAEAARQSDAKRLLSWFDLEAVTLPPIPGRGSKRPQVVEATIQFLERPLTAAAMTRLIQRELEAHRFEMVRVSGLKVRILEQQRRAEARFRVLAAATPRQPGPSDRYGAGSGVLDLTLGFREVSQGVWKVDTVDSPDEAIQRLRP
ncbi:hypothetical protein Isop_3549 [Isosphaera pallida ATCC 43644]|jgi:hypothetical protein|uniref:Uncharacterized protein n=1 Tax=Isosphaera pallida (strain ATCC 43644 / DSM 9630 / IS1B) TaxID=575540 RepID=E8QXR9_ISOPI|nr:hypothetical protein [Isosphaera pallida]ADV64106.1 hypothetical protein Isop_3549 [Isosphaera pallida ATCC 43644]